MSIPLATTEIQLLAPTTTPGGGGDDDWGGAPDPTTGYTAVGGAVRAHLSAPSGSASAQAGAQTVSVQFRLLCDPCEMLPDMQVRDVETGVTYFVEWCQAKAGPMPHVIAGVTYVTNTP